MDEEKIFDEETEPEFYLTEKDLQQIKEIIKEIEFLEASTKKLDEINKKRGDKV